MTPSSNGPIVPPDLHSTVPYSTIVHETPIIGQYVKLNHNLHASVQVYDHTQHSHSHISTPIPRMYSTLPTNGDMTSHISSPDSQYSILSNKTSNKLTIKKTTGQ